jgi:glycosyltransferase involved in cell wall biosynthesis
MRILHVVHQYFPDHVGGTEYYARTSARFQRQMGHRVAIFCRRTGTGQHLDLSEDAGTSTGTSPAIRVYRAANGPFTPTGRFRSSLGDRFLAGCLARTVSDFQPDLVHIHHLMGLPVNALLDVSQVAPLVVTLHDYWWVCANAQLITDYDSQVCDGPHWWLNCARCGLSRASAGVQASARGERILRQGSGQALSPLVAPLFAWRAALIRRLMPHVAAWMALTSFVADWHLAYGFPAERMHVVPQGIELPPDEAGQAAAAPPGQNGQPASNFAYVGGLARQKGVHVLIDAFNQLPPSVRLKVVGDEAAFPDYCALLRSRATHPGIEFVGRLDRDGVWQILDQTDVLVVPSLWYETSSLVVQEAFATGTPVVAANHGALAERVRHEANGLLTPPGDGPALLSALQRLIDEPGLLAHLRSGIQPVVELAQHLRGVEQVYRQVLAE